MPSHAVEPREEHDDQPNGGSDGHDAEQFGGSFAEQEKSDPVTDSERWIFMPVSRAYASVSSSITGQDYSALLMGEVSGNWTNTGARPVGSRQLAVGSNSSGPEPSTAVKLPLIETPTDGEIIVPVTVQSVANKGIISYEFELRYDPSVIQPEVNPVDTDGTVSSRLSVAANTEEPGLLRVAVYGPLPISSNGVLLNLKFTAIGAPGAVSPLVWERIMFNEGSPRVRTADGQIELFAAPKS